MSAGVGAAPLGHGGSCALFTGLGSASVCERELVWASVSCNQ